MWKFETLSWASFAFRLTSNSAAEWTVLGAVLSFLFDRHKGVWLLLSHPPLTELKNKKTMSFKCDWWCSFFLSFSLVLGFYLEPNPPLTIAIKIAGEIPQVSTPHGQSILMLCNTLAPFDVIYLPHGVKFLHHLAPSKKAWNHRDIMAPPSTQIRRNTKIYYLYDFIPFFLTVCHYSKIVARMRTSHNKTATTRQTPKTDLAPTLSQQQQKAKIKLWKNG